MFMLSLTAMCPLVIRLTGANPIPDVNIAFVSVIPLSFSKSISFLRAYSSLDTKVGPSAEKIHRLTVSQGQYLEFICEFLIVCSLCIYF